MLIEAPVLRILSLALQVLSLATQGGKLELPALCGQSPSESPVLYSETRPTNAEIDAREQGCWYMQEHAQTKSCKRPKLPGPSLCPKYDADSKIVNSGTGRQPSGAALLSEGELSRLRSHGGGTPASLSGLVSESSVNSFFTSQFLGNPQCTTAAEVT